MVIQEDNTIFNSKDTWGSLSLYLWHHWWSTLYLSLCVGVGSLKLPSVQFMHTLSNRHSQKSKSISERVFTSNRKINFTPTLKFKNIRKYQLLLIFVGGGGGPKIPKIPKTCLRNIWMVHNASWISWENTTDTSHFNPLLAAGMNLTRDAVRRYLIWVRYAVEY